MPGDCLAAIFDGTRFYVRMVTQDDSFGQKVMA